MRTDIGLELGVFLPVANQGWVLSAAAPAAPPTFETNRWIVQRAERLGFSWALAQSVWRGHGGATDFWNVSLEGFTLMAALARETELLSLIASVPPLLYPPAVAAKMVATLDEVSNGRAGMNVVAGAHLAEYSQMGLLPDDYGNIRYDYADDWMRAVRELWVQTRSSHRGPHVWLDDCVSRPAPLGEPPVICAGTSEAGMRFALDHGTHAFVGAHDVASLDGLVRRYRAAAAANGRSIRLFTAINYLLEDTDAEAEATEAHYRAHPDVDAVASLVGEYSKPDAGMSLRAMIVEAQEHVFFGGVVAGGPQRVASHLAALRDVGLDGVLVTFTDWQRGFALLEHEVLPVLAARRRD